MNTVYESKNKIDRYIFYRLLYSKTIQMLTRSKIKMQESIHRVQEQLPYFNQHSARHHHTSHRHHTEIQDSNHHSYQHHRNQVLRQLRQEYQILRNLHVDSNVSANGKGGDRLSQGSAGSSSVRSKQSQSGGRSRKIGSREMESLHLEKKQLEIVIGNSMRKIEELLNNQIALKKTIHQLRGQVEGRGGVHAEHERIVKAHQRREEELESELSTLQRQCERVVHKNKEQAEKIKSIEEKLRSADEELKQARGEQSKWHDLLRNEKDRVLNMEIQVKSVKMESDLTIKQKESQITQLARQLDAAQSEGIGREGAANIRRLEEQIREKEGRIRQLLQERQRRRSEVVEVMPLPSSKNYLQQLLYKSREMNEQSNKALTDSVNMVMARMAELQKRNDDTLKKEIEQLRKRTQQARRSNPNDDQLQGRINELERLSEREAAEKARFAGELKALRDHKRELEDRVKSQQKKIRELEQKREDLTEEVRELDQYRSKYSELQRMNATLKEEVNTYGLRINQYETKIVQLRAINRSAPSSPNNRNREEQLQRQVQSLRRQVDEANFRIEKLTKEAEVQTKILKTEHNSELERSRAEITRLSAKLSDCEAALSLVQNSHDDKARGKEKEVFQLRQALQSIRNQHEQELLKQKKFYQDRSGGIDHKHSAEVAHLNERLLQVAASNEKLMKQVVAYGGMESELHDLRRALRQSRNINTTVDHLWQVKQTEYGNITQILRDVQ